MLFDNISILQKADGGFGEHTCSFDKLPDELLLHIFQRVDASDNHKKQSFRAVSLVCKRWHFISNAAKSSLSVSGLKAARLARLLSRFTDISILNLSFLFDCSDDVLEAVGKFCWRLIELHVPDSYKSTDGRGLEAMAGGCPSLEVLSLHGFKGQDKALVTLASKCRNLMKLRLRSAQNITDAAVDSFAANCRRLQELDLSFNNITDASLKSIGRGLTHLQHLDLKHCKNVTGDGVAAVAAGCPLLQTLHLGVVEIGDSGLFALGKHSKLLEELYLDYGNGNREISREAMASLAAGCSKLRVLSLRGSKQVDDDVLHGLARGCPSLAELDLHACDKVTDVGLCSIVKGCKKLNILVLTGTSVGVAGVDTFKGGLPCASVIRMNGEMISDGVLESIGKYCPKVSELHFAHCHVSDDGIQKLLQGCAQSLRSLTIKSCADIKGVGFSTTCPNLESLHLHACGMVDAGVLMVLEKCPKLHHLAIPSSPKLTGDGLYAALLKNSSLRELNVACCTQLCKEDVFKLTARSSKISVKSIRISRPGSPDDEYTLKKNHGHWMVPNWARQGHPAASPPWSPRSL